MPRRIRGETGFYHVTVRSAGQIALFEDDADRQKFLQILREARDALGARIIAWVLMTDHVHLVCDFGEDPNNMSKFMYRVNKSYAAHFNERTGRVGHLFQNNFWSKPISNDAQLIATVHYVHMNPERGGMAAMRTYRWSSYQEYAHDPWLSDTDVVLGLFGSFEAFDAYEGSAKNTVRQHKRSRIQDNDALNLALELARCASSDDLRRLPKDERNDLVVCLWERGVCRNMIARVLGIGASTVSRILRQQ